MVQDRAILTVRDQYDPANGATFSDLERPITPISRSRHDYLTLNNSETVRDTDTVSIEY